MGNNLTLLAINQYCWKWNFSFEPVCLSVGLSVGRFVCHNCLRGQEVSLPCSYRSTSLFAVLEHLPKKSGVLLDLLKVIVLFLYYYGWIAKTQSYLIDRMRELTSLNWIHLINHICIKLHFTSSIYYPNILYGVEIIKLKSSQQDRQNKERI